MWLNVGVLLIRLMQLGVFMPKASKDGSPLKHITIKARTHEALNKVGFRGETFDDIIWRIIEKTSNIKEGEN